MKNLSLFLACFLLIFTIACSDKDSKQQLLVESCAIIENAKILPEDEVPCHYNTVFDYRSDIYLTCECCVCDKASFAISCDSVLLCDITEYCMEDFYKEAIYLFRVEAL